MTLGNLLGGAVVCWAAASGEFLGQALLWDSAGSDMALATQMVAAVWMFAMLCDAFDGWAARKLGVDGALGVQLDSLADVVTGGLAPAMVAMRLAKSSPLTKGITLGSIIIIICPTLG